MFEFMDLFSFGRKVEAHGEQWHVVKTLQGGFVLAIKADAIFPCQVYLIQEEPRELSTIMRELEGAKNETIRVPSTMSVSNCGSFPTF